MDKKSYSIGAKRIDTMIGDPLVNHWINVVDDRVESITPKPTEREVSDFGESCIILPGTVNMHAHLEMSQMSAPIRQPISFTDWIGEVMAFRRRPEYNAEQAVWSAMLRSDVLTEYAVVADIVPNEELSGGFVNTRHPRFLEYLPFIELVAWRPEQVEAKFECLHQPAYLSPHAPHTVCPALLERTVELGVPIAMHLAETPDEMELLQHQTGALVEMMRQFDPDYDPKKVLLGNRPMDYLKLLAETPKAIIIHGNYLDDEELRFLAAHRETMTVVYCPRSHAYFGHSPYPLRKMLDFGVRVTLGTDSLASVPDLSLVNELRFAMAQHPNVPSGTIFRMGTSEGAEFLGFPELGKLQPGSPAKFAFFT
ncbi:chlorohydrolase [Planctomycetales bacterium]|nr:chlorohydrolase [Planctomycetales bacterium]